MTLQLPLHIQTVETTSPLTQLGTSQSIPSAQLATSQLTPSAQLGTSHPIPPTQPASSPSTQPIHLTQPPLVEVENLCLRFGTEDVLKGVSFRLQAGECLALVGESGSGKSVTARSLIGLSGAGATLTAQSLSYAGRDLRRYREREWKALRGAKIGYVLQDALVSLDPLRRIGEEVGEAVRSHLHLRGKDLAAAVENALLRAGIPDPARRAAQYPHELSGGLCQRALIAAAIAAAPDLIIADEPTTALDVTVQAEILKLFAGLKAEGKAILFISHDLAAVAQIADRIAVMRHGEIVETGPTRDILRAPSHPYTRALLQAVPQEHQKGARLSAIPAPPAPAVPPATGHVLAQARGLCKSYNAIPSVRDISFTLHAGETLGIAGESGSGKTTTSRLLLGLLQPDAGDVTIAGEPWGAGTAAERLARRRKIQVIWQNPLASFDPRHTVGQIIDEALSVAGGAAGAARKRAGLDLLEQVGLGGQFWSRSPATLSGGQRQRVAIARALAPQPQIIVCDEPVSALDVSIQAQILDLLGDLQRQTGVAYFFITHDLGVLRHISDRVLIMKDGAVVEEGPTQRVLDTPQHPYTQRLKAAIPRI